jgi:hypothetical protein
MGFITETTPGIGMTSKPTTPSISGVSENAMSIYNYNKIVVHVSSGKTQANGKTSTTFTLTQEGCYHNGQPMWTFHDGFYDGDFDTYTGKHHHHRHVHDARFGSALCEGASHKLRYGGEGGTGSWEFVSHGYINSWTTADTLNFFSVQGSGATDGSAGNGRGGWIAAVGAADNFPYGRLRGFPLAAGGVRTMGAGGVTGITTDGVIGT